MTALLDPITLISLGLGLMTAMAFMVTAALVQGTGRRRFRRRIQSVTSINRQVPMGGRSQTTLRLTRQESATPTIDALVRRWLPNRDALTQRIARTGLPISIGQYGVATVGLILIVTTIAALVFGFKPATSITIGVALGFSKPYWLIGKIGDRRVAAFINLFPDAIDLMVRALRSGLPISEAIVNAGQEIRDPVGAEFRNVEAGMRMGRELESLLWEISKRIDAPEYRFFIIALTVQRETGGNLAETLHNLSDLLRRRRAMRAKARAMSSEARASMMILGSLPVLVTIVLMMTSPNYIMLLFTDPRGLVLCAIALGMLGTGIISMNKMAKFEI